MRAKRKLKRPNIYHVTLHGTGKRLIRIPIRLVEADRPESFVRTKRHVRMGTEGLCATCANSEGALESLGGDGWVFTGCRAIKLKTNSNGELKWGTLYSHSQGEFQREFDEKGKDAMLASPRCEGVVRLSVPPKFKASGSAGPRGPRGPRKDYRGALARLQRRGVVIRQP